jgi:putative peptidoglycan lipid II flippase
MSENRKLLKATGIISSGTFLSRIFGFIRDMVIASIFGAGFSTDAFFVAFKIPNLLRRLLGEGALSAAFIPLFTEYFTVKSEEEAWNFASAVFSALLIILSAITVIGIIFMPAIITILAPGFYAEPQKFNLTVYLTRITFPYIFLISLTALSMGILNSLRHFTIPAMSPVLLNFSLIGAAFFICPYLKIPVSGLAIGVIIGGILQLILHIPPLIKSGMKFTPDFSLGHPGIKKVVLLMAPSIIGLAATQFNIFIDTLIASLLTEGSISYLYYADRVMQLPLGVFGTAIGTAILPTLSSFAVKRDMQGMRDTLSFGLRFTFFIAIPAMTAQIVLSLPIISLLFERGEFSHQSAIHTSQALIAYSLGLWAYSGIKVIAPAYYSVQDTKTPVRIAVISMITNVVFNLILMFPLKHAGIALATSLSAMLNLGLLIYYLPDSIKRIDWRQIRNSVLKIGLSSAVMGTICYLAVSLQPYPLIKPGVSLGVWRLIWLSFVMLTGLIVYFGMAILTKSEEMRFLIDAVKSKMRVKPS